MSWDVTLENEGCGALSEPAIDLLRRLDRVAIVGGPRSGKTTLTHGLKREVIHTDDLMTVPWEQIPLRLFGIAERHERFVMEGVQTARALRKGLNVDGVIYLQGSIDQLTPQQNGMRKAVEKWFKDWLVEWAVNRWPIEVVTIDRGVKRPAQDLMKEVPERPIRSRRLRR